MKKWWAAFFVAIIMFLMLGYVIAYGKDIYIPIHDNLEDIYTRHVVLKDNNLFWTTSTKAPILGGLDRNSLPSDLKIQSIIYMLFPGFTAYIILYFSKLILAIWGGIFLGKEILKESFSKHKNLIILCSFAYGLAPNCPAFPLCFASLPLLLFLFIKIWNKPKWIHYVMAFLYASISDLTYFGMFICAYICITFIVYFFVTRKAKWQLLGVLLSMAAGYIVVEWRLFYLVFKGEELIRSSMIQTVVSFKEAVKLSGEGFIEGHYHSADAHFYIILPVCLFNFIYTNICEYRKTGIKGCMKKPFNWVLFFILFNSICYGFDSWGPIVAIKNFIPGLKGFSIARTLWFNGFLWYLLFVMSIHNIRVTGIKYILCFSALVIVCFVPGTYNHIQSNIQYRLAKDQVISESYLEDHLSYREFFSEDLFTQIKRDIDYNGEWSIAYGMHPAILNCNKISTLDGYHPYYSQTYKEVFRELIEPELQIDPKNREYYDTWGGRAYIFSPNITYEPRRRMKLEEDELKISIKVFRLMSGKYVFSRVRIINSDTLGLSLVNAYMNNNSPYTIYVYELI